MDMRAVDVLTNLKNWPAYDYKAYKLDKHEADPCINALENYIWHEVEREGWPKENGFFLFKVHFKNDDPKLSQYCFKHLPLFQKDLSEYFDEHTLVATHWRKIVDEEDAYYERS